MNKNSISFVCDYHEKLYKNQLLKMDTVALLDVECGFCIKINGRTFYEQPLFPILEFLRRYLEWDQKHAFIYNTLESDEQPMIAFQRHLFGWRLQSVWQKFNCTTSFCLADFVEAIEALFLQFGLDTKVN